MANGRLNLLDALDELLDLPEPQRPGRMEAMGLSDDDRSRIEDWLKHGGAQGSSGDPLDRPPPVLREARRLLSATGEGGSSGLVERMESAAPPPQIPGYEVLSPLGCGGMATVWKARQISTGRAVALKVMSPWLFASPRARARFEREVRLASRLQHPHIARVYDGGSAAGVCYYALELVEGEHLDRYATYHKLDRRQVLRLMREVCLAVRHAHQKGIIHRDLKPSNVLVDADGHPHVLDFGLARAVEEGADARLTLTQEGQPAGTLAFMSPEQASGDAGLLDVRTDVYGLGATLLLLLTGQPPHDTSGPRHEILRRISGGEIRRPRQLCKGIDAELEAVLLKALAPEPEQRYGSAGALAEEIDRYLRGEALEARQPTFAYVLRKQLRKHRRALAAAAAVAAVLVGCFAYAYRQVSRARDDALIAREGERRQRLEAEKREREAQLGLADSLVSEGDARAAAQQWVDAVERYNLAQGVYARLGVSAMRADSGLSAAYQFAPPPLAELMGHTGVVHSVAVSPDDRLVASGGADKTLRVWEAVPGRCLHVTDHPAAVKCVAFSRDSRRVASGDHDGVIRLWELDSGRAVGEFKGHRGEVWVICFSPDGRYMVSSSFDATVRLWEVESGRQVREFEHLSGHGAAFSPDGQSIWIAGDSLHKWDLATGSKEYEKQWVNARCLAVSQDGQVLVGRHGDNQLVFVQPAENTVVKAGAHDGPVTGIAFSSDGRRVLSSGSDDTLRSWNAHTREQVGIVRVPTSSSIAAWSSDGTWAAKGGHDGVVRLWDLTPDMELPTLRAHRHINNGEGVEGIAISPDNRLVASAGKSETILWDRVTGHRLLSVSSSGGRAVAFSPGSDRLALDAGELVCVLNLADPTNVHRLGYHDEPVWAAAVSPDGKRLLSSSGVSVRAWDLEHFSQLWSARAPTVIAPAVAFSSDGRRALAASLHGFALVYDADTGQYVPGLDLNARWGGRILGDGVGCTSDGSIAFCNAHGLGGFGLFNCLSGRPLRHFKGKHFGFGRGVDVSPDDRWGVATGRDGTVKLWDLRAGHDIRTFTAHSAAGNCVAFSPDGALIASGGADLICQVRDLSRPEQYRRFRPRLEAARQSLQRDPRDSSASVTLAEWHAFRGRLKWAEGAWRIAREGNPGVPSLPLAQCLWQLGDISAARREFQRALDRREAPAPYLRLCLGALGGAPAVEVASAELLARRGRFQAALAEYRGQLAAGPTTHLPFSRCAALLLYLGDEAAYREVCRQMLARFHDPDRPDDAEHTVRTCLLLPDVLSPDAREDRQLLLRLATRLAEQFPQNHGSWQALGLAHLRRGDGVLAVEQFQKALAMPLPADVPNPLTGLLLSIAYAKLGRGAEAQQALAAAEQAMAAHAPRPGKDDMGGAWHNWLACELFRREAAAALNRLPSATAPAGPFSGPACGARSPPARGSRWPR